MYCIGSFKAGGKRYVPGDKVGKLDDESTKHLLKKGLIAEKMPAKEKPKKTTQSKAEKKAIADKKAKADKAAKSLTKDEKRKLEEKAKAEKAKGK